MRRPLLLTLALRAVSEVRPLAPLFLDAPVSVTAVAPETLPDAQEVDPTPDPFAVELVEADWEDEIWPATEVVSLGEVALGAEEAEVLPAAEVVGVNATEAPLEEVVVGEATELDELSEPWPQVEADWVEDEPVPFIPLRRRAEHLAARLAAGAVLEPDEVDDTDHDDTPVASARDVAAELLEEDLLASDLDGDAPVARGIESDDSQEGATQRMPTEILDADGTPLAVLDEAALQEIVRQMIREELQGSLGERITRNVRKLVRAEINRALVARDLD